VDNVTTGEVFYWRKDDRGSNLEYIEGSSGLSVLTKKKVGGGKLQSVDQLDQRIWTVTKTYDHTIGGFLEGGIFKSSARAGGKKDKEKKGFFRGT